jgi:beta-N-acetylhexosaminidase
MINKRKAFITGIKSVQLTMSEKRFLRKHKPWGVILFSRNIKSIRQTKLLTNTIRKIFKDPYYPILIDQEGGRVNRLKNIITFDNLTSEYFGNLYIKDKRKFNIIYKLFIDKTSYLLKQIGVNINTLPVLDLKIKGSSNIIGDRSFSQNKRIVSKIGDICIDLFNGNSIGTVIKHIPGHGLAKVDSHHFTPVVDKNVNYLNKNDFFPFKNKDSLFAMTAHIIYKKIDPHNTATHSKTIINTIRKKIGFKNVLISDDLSMKSLKYDLSTNTIKSFEAGCNLALHCNGNFNEMKVVAENSPLVNNFIIKKTSLFYKNLS